MRGYSATRDERWLRRFIVRLVAFAALAEEAAGRSAPVRWLVLWILRRAETLMEEFVVDVTGALPPLLERMASVGNDPADALRLAARFRALAAVLGALLSVAFRLDPSPARRAFALAHVAPSSGHLLVGWTPKLNDTS